MSESGSIVSSPWASRTPSGTLTRSLLYDASVPRASVQYGQWPRRMPIRASRELINVPRSTPLTLSSCNYLSTDSRKAWIRAPLLLGSPGADILHWGPCEQFNPATALRIMPNTRCLVVRPSGAPSSPNNPLGIGIPACLPPRRGQDRGMTCSFGFAGSRGILAPRPPALALRITPSSPSPPLAPEVRTVGSPPLAIASATAEPRPTILARYAEISHPFSSLTLRSTRSRSSPDVRPYGSPRP